VCSKVVWPSIQTAAQGTELTDIVHSTRSSCRSRLAGVNDLVTRAVSGHSDIAMQELYSTIRGEEMRKSLAAVVQLAGLS
jgi:hypothetical protein